MRLAEINNVVVSGRLTQDARHTTTQNGKGVLSCQVAVNKRYLDSTTNEWKDDTVFVGVVVWGDSANRLKDRCHKGTPVFVEGRLTTSEYTDKEGNVRRNLQITASRLQVLESNSQAEEPVEKESSTVEPVEKEVEEDEVPF